MLPLVGAGASIFGAALGAGAQRDAANKNFYVDMLNYYARERERRQRVQAMERERSDTHLGSTDADGNSVKFVEGKGWVTTRSQKQEGLANAQQAEQMKVLSQDLPAARQQRERNAKRQKEEDYVAEGLRDEFQRIRLEDPRAIESILLNAATLGQSEAFDDAQENAMKKALRTGASNTGKIIAELGRERADAFANARVKARLQARGLAQGEFDERRKGVANLYNQFATRAGAMPNVSYKPENIDGGSDVMAGNLMKGKLALADELGKAYGQKGGEWSYVEPQYALANGITGAGNQLAQAFGRMQSQDNWMQTRQQYADQYLPQNEGVF